MTRDMDLIRMLLMKLELLEPTPNGYRRLYVRDFQESESYPPEVVAAHLQLMHDAKLFMSHKNSSDWRQYSGLAWGGHDFLDSVRDDEIWERTKKGALAAGGFSFDLLKDLAKGYLRKQISDKTGIPL